MSRTAAPSSMSVATRHRLRELGEGLKAARLARGLTQSEVAERLGVSRFTVMALERGEPGVAIGTVLEAAALLDLPLSEGSNAGVARTLLQFLPTRARRQPVKVDDDF